MAFDHSFFITWKWDFRQTDLKVQKGDLHPSPSLFSEPLRLLSTFQGCYYSCKTENREHGVNKGNGKMKNGNKTTHLHPTLSEPNLP